MELICPKCQGSMRSYERAGITIDQCAECRGIFLDRGELERLVDAEASFNAAARPPAGPGAVPPAPVYGSPPVDDRYRGEGYRDDRYRDDRYRDDHHRGGGYRDDRSKDGYYDPRRKKKRSFLEDLFD